MSKLLTITRTASEAIDAIVASNDQAPDGAGLRISRATGENGQPGLMLALVPAPEPADQVIEATGHPVFLESDVVDELDDKVLDAQVEGAQVGFVLTDRG